MIITKKDEFILDWEIGEALDEARWHYRDMRSRGWKFERLRLERLNIMLLHKYYNEFLDEHYFK